jgi:hypothetical protein
VLAAKERRWYLALLAVVVLAVVVVVVVELEPTLLQTLPDSHKENEAFACTKVFPVNVEKAAADARGSPADKRRRNKTDVMVCVVVWISQVCWITSVWYQNTNGLLVEHESTNEVFGIAFLFASRCGRRKEKIR